MVIVLFFLVVIFFILSAFFSGIETGLISIDRFKLEQESKSDLKKKQILHFLENPDKLFGTTLFGTNISVVIVSSICMYIIHHYKDLNIINFSENTGTLIVAGLLLIFGEIIPKAIYRESPIKLVTRFFQVLKFFYVVFKPFVKFVRKFDSSLAKLFNLQGSNPYNILSKEDLSFMLDHTEKDSFVRDEQKELLEEALEFVELKAENAMTHRTEIVAISKTTNLEEVIELAKKEGFTRFPVFDTNLDEIVGILIIYDILKKKNISNMKAGDLMRKVFFAPENMDINILLAEMQKEKRSMVIVVDAYGGTAGLLTIEDILEEIVGEIEDEYDVSSEEVIKIDDHSYIVQGYVEIDFLNDNFEMNLPEGDYETIAGLILSKIARIPTYKTIISIEGWDLVINRVTHKKIEEIKMVDKRTNIVKSTKKNEKNS
ncbi:MAG: hemolysin family protein [Candidatus Cloacimonetes bacterium]|nr:hemolysin family protein [Candidatus Cloacimonadota bacterium]